MTDHEQKPDQLDPMETQGAVSSTGLPPAPRRPTGLLIVAVLIIGGVAAYMAKRNWPEPTAQAAPTKLMCATDGCGYAGQEVLAVGETLPLKCPKCGKQSLYHAYTCSKCGTLVILNEDRGLPAPTKCPKCSAGVVHGN